MKPMALSSSSPDSDFVAQVPESQGYGFALVSLTTLFFLWGFITCLNDILIPHLRNVFELSYTKAALIQFCFFGAYFVVSIPAGALIKRVGYKSGIIVGLVIAGLGCLLFYPAASWRVYEVFLAALFVLASGITILQVSANPYVTRLGQPGTAASRLTLTQAFNSLGTTIAPLFGAVLILSGITAGMSDAEVKLHEAQSVQGPYLFLAMVLITMAIVFAFLRLPRIVDEELQLTTRPAAASAWAYPHLRYGAVGIFLYVGAEVAIGSFLVNFLMETSRGGLTETTAAGYIAWYWGAAMVGRFIGAMAMQRIDARLALAFNAVAACVLVALAIVSMGSLAMWAILAVGFFNSIMFPTIFSLAIKNLGAHTSEGSGILCLAIVGGAVVPLLQGALADLIGLQPAFFLPILCYIFIVWYGMKGCRISTPSTMRGEAETSRVAS